MESKAVLPGRTATLLAAASTVILLAATKAFAPILGPILLSILLALTVRPLVDWLARRGLRQKLAFLVSFVLILVVGLVLISLIGVSLMRIRDTLPVYEERLGTVLTGLQARLAAQGIDISGLTSNVASPERIVALGRQLLTGASSILSGAFLILLLVILFVAEMPLVNKVLEGGRKQHWTQLSSGIQKYIALTGLMGSINAALNLVLLLVLGVDFPVLWAVLCFFLNFVPAVGNLLALTPPALLALLEFGWQRALVVAVGFFVTNTLMDLVVKPKLMKTSLDISPLLVILSLVVWGWVLGPAGPVLAIPLTMVVLRMVRTAPAAEETSGVS